MEEQARSLEERKEVYLSKIWMHEPPKTEEHRLELLSTISAQCTSAYKGIAPGCAMCEEGVSWTHLFRCFQCGLWLCPMCAKAHFKTNRGS